MLSSSRFAVPVLELIFAIWCASPTFASEIVFRRHVIDAEAQFCAAAAIDVNHDGQFDIVCGRNWYKVPTWKKHFVSRC